MIIAKKIEDEYQIRFKYDPEIVDIIKSVPTRKWHSGEKYWSINSDKIGFLVYALKGTVFENDLKIQSDENIGINSSIDISNKIPDIDISNYQFCVADGSTPYKHQIDTLKYAVDRYNKGITSGFLLCDEPGEGKTLSTINVALYNKQFRGYKHCLIICCVNTSKYNWYDDIIKHTNGKEKPYILGTRLRRNGTEQYDTGSKEKLQDLISGHMYGNEEYPELPYFLILNIEALRFKQKKIYPITEEIIRWINENNLQMICIDEVHHNASPSSQQGKQLLKIKARTSSKVEYIPITGTPIINKPTDLFIPLRLIDAHTSNSYWTWRQTYCIFGGYGGHEIVAYKNIPQLKNTLQYHMLRRLRKDTLDLPPKQQLTVYVENSPIQQKLYEKVRLGILDNRQSIISSLNPMTEILKLRQVNGSPEIIDNTIKVDSAYINKNAKLKAVFDILSEIFERDEKVVIYSNWITPLRTLYRFTATKYKVVAYVGTMPTEQREKSKKQFIEDPNTKIILGTIGALGTSHTLTVAKNIIFLDEPWTAADKHQAEDRIYRIGTSDSVRIYTIITKDTVDERVHNILYTKQGISEFITDNIDIHNNPELFDLLLAN